MSALSFRRIASSFNRHVTTNSFTSKAAASLLFSARTFNSTTAFVATRRIFNSSLHPPKHLISGPSSHLLLNQRRMTSTPPLLVSSQPASPSTLVAIDGHQTYTTSTHSRSSHLSSPSPDSPSTGGSPFPPPPPSSQDKKATLGELAARYGLIATITYLVLSQSIFWLIYLGLRMSGLETESVLSVLPESWVGSGSGATGSGASGSSKDDSLDASGATPSPTSKLPSFMTDYIDPAAFGVTFIVSKILVPVKLAMVVWLTPRVARFWWRLGVVKPPAGVKLGVGIIGGGVGGTGMSGMSNGGGGGGQGGASHLVGVGVGHGASGIANGGPLAEVKEE